MRTNNQTQLEEHLHQLEQELQAAYLQLGKKTQEFVEQESDDINRLVDEIILTKKAIEQKKEKPAKEKEYD